MTADVTDFSLDFTATIISSGLLEDMDLKDLDEVAYVRFASVYRQFKDINTFMNELKILLGEN